MAEPHVPAFGELLKRLREDAGLTQRELASAAGVAVRTISDLERGVSQTARKETARLLAEALGLNESDRAAFMAAARGLPLPMEVPRPTMQGGGMAAATRTLPRDIASFVGRETQLRCLLEASERADEGGIVAIHAIGGMAGIGKTALAVHAAHVLAERYPDGQIFLHLHGHTPGHRPVDPADALASLLLTAGVQAQQILPGLEARMGLWRDHLAGKRLLLLLDNAVDTEQIQPLLPGSAGSLVLVTSRRHLTALEDAQAISLDPLLADEAVALLVRLAGRSGMDSRDPAAAEIAALCGYLPLAIGMLGRKLHHHPAWAPAQLAAFLAAARNRLGEMETENLSVAAAFDLSYQELSSDEQRLFRRLGLHPGTDIDTYAAAALDATDLDSVGRHLEALYDHYLLTEPARGRYRMHDLIREHARALTVSDPATDRDTALERLLDYYQLTAAIAEGHLARQTRPGSAPAGLLSRPPAIPELPGSVQALQWARTERSNLLACLERATRASQHARIVGFTAGLASLLRQDGPWTEAIIRHATAVRAAQYLGERLSEADALLNLGNARRLAGEFPAGADALQAALSIYRDLGDRLGQANALREIGVLRRQIDDYTGAVEALDAALLIYRDDGDQLGQANVLNGLGTVQRLTGNFREAAHLHEEALRLSRDIEDRLSEATALLFMGAARLQVHDYLNAAEALEAALGISRNIGDRQTQVNALTFLGPVRRLIGDYTGAAQAHKTALSISREIGDRLGQVNALFNLGIAQTLTGDFASAAKTLEQSLKIARHIGSRIGEANALKGLGAVHRMTGDAMASAQVLFTALRITREVGDRAGEVETLNELGTLHLNRGDLQQAVEFHQQALNLAREIASPWDEAHALVCLGRCSLANGSAGTAKTRLRQALEIFQRIGAADAASVSAELDGLTGAGDNDRSGGCRPPS